jgi:hypothetical protein
MIFKFLFYAFLFYLMFRLIFNFILPIYRTTKQVKRSFREMHEQMNQHQREYPGNGSTGADAQTSQQNKTENLNTDQLGEYIDFEEVK